MNKNKDLQAISAVLDYLTKQNRPYSATDVVNNLHNEYSKSIITKTLDSLAADGKINSKTYNKQVVYVANQNNFTTVNESDLKVIESKILEFTEKLKRLNDDIKQSETTLNGLNTQIPTEEAKNLLANLNKECESLREKLLSLKANKNSVSPQEREKILKSRLEYNKEWRKRKRTCDEMVNTIMEGYPKTKKFLLEEVGIETDEDVGVKIPV